MKDKISNPIAVRAILLAVAALLIALQVAGVVFGMKYLSSYATSVAEISAKTNATEDTINKLVQAQQELTSQKAIVEKVQKIAAESTSYRYQNQVIEDLSRYALQTGVIIKGFSFDDPAAKPTAESAKTASPTIPGVKTTRVKLNLESPIPYDVLMQFLMLLENNVTRFQVTDLSVSSAEVEGSPDQSWVNVPSLTVEVYLQQ